jgi:hypothetical protein
MMFLLSLSLSSYLINRASSRSLGWPSGWVRTLFVNPTRPDGQDPKPSPRVRTPELVQDSGRTGSDHSDQFIGQNSMFWLNPKSQNDRSTRELNAQFEYRLIQQARIERSSEQKSLFDSTRRTSMSVLFNPSNKNPNPFNSLEQDLEPVQPFRTEGVHPTLPKPRVGRPSSGSTQPDGHPTGRVRSK